jgi:hypothetical protein
MLEFDHRKRAQPKKKTREELGSFFNKKRKET